MSTANGEPAADDGSDRDRRGRARERMRGPHRHRMGRTLFFIVAGGFYWLGQSSMLQAQVPSGCYEVCAATCLKPLVFPDRWDDSGVPGASGWSGNGVWDRESFTDANGNGLYDPGEPFVDGSSAFGGTGSAGPRNGAFDAEFYHPFLTGYIASGDFGLELTLLPGTVSAPATGRYYFIDLPGSIGGTDYRWNFANCNPSLLGSGDMVNTENGDMVGPTAQGLRDLINRDPTAYWDDGCSCVQGSVQGDHPRTLLLGVGDPRIGLSPEKQAIHIVKLVALFLESSKANGSITGRLTTAQAASGSPCETNGAGFLYDCAVPAERSTWGGLKAHFR